MSFKESVFFHIRGVHAFSRGLILFPPVRGDGCNMRGNIPGETVRPWNYLDDGSHQISPFMVVAVITVIRGGIMSHVIGNPEDALLLSVHSLMDIGIGTYLRGLLFRIGNMGWGVHILILPILYSSYTRSQYDRQGKDNYRPVLSI